MPFASNVELVGYHDLNGRPGFKLAMQEVNNRFFLYVASLWQPGLSVLDVTEPESPRLLHWIEGPPNTSTTQVQVADGRMITSLAHRAPEWVAHRQQGMPADGLVVWDVSQPESPVKLGRWTSGAQGTHRNFYSGGPYVHATTTLPGFQGHVYGVIDISDPGTPILVGKWWWPGQNTAAGEEYSQAEMAAQGTGRAYEEGGGPMHAFSLHGGAYVTGNRAYCPWMRAGLVILDVESVLEPKIVSRLSFYPPLGSTIAAHTAVPIIDRQLVIVNSEALREGCDEPVNFAGIVDMGDEADPILISLFPQPRVPAGYPTRTFCARGGRFGPHNQHQPQGMSCLEPHSDLVYMTYFNAGLQIYDIREPRDPFIAGFYIPDDPKQRFGPLPKQLVTQVEDVIVDRRGNIFITEKNTGLHVLRFSGRGG